MTFRKILQSSYFVYKSLQTYYIVEEKGSFKSDNDLLSSRRSQPSEEERMWRGEASDYEARFCGHCNTTTDIKEANFFGR